MQTHVINIQLTIKAQDGISRGDLMYDLRKLLGELQEPPEFRSIHGAGWGVSGTEGVTMLKFSSISEQAEYDAEVRRDDEMRAQVAAEMTEMTGAHYHDARGHEDTLCTCPSPGTYAPQWPQSATITEEKGNDSDATTR